MITHSLTLSSGWPSQRFLKLQNGMKTVLNEVTAEFHTSWSLLLPGSNEVVRTPTLQVKITKAVGSYLTQNYRFNSAASRFLVSSPNLGLDKDNLFANSPG